MIYSRLLPLAAAAVMPLALCGCMTAQLHGNTLRQAASYGDVHEQQVLNNLAKFVHDVNSFPSFSYADSGVNNVQDKGALSSTTLWSRIAGGIYGWTSTNLAPSAERTMYENWTLKPVNDPRRLELMRCAYQRVVLASRAASGGGDCGGVCAAGVCPDCAKRLNGFYTGKGDTPPDPGSAEDKGRTTHLCLGANPCWFGWGGKHDAPKHVHCLKVGHYCGTYVWVLPGGQDELTKLTLAILDYAVNAPVELAKPVKEVTFYIDQFGLPTTKDKARGEVKGTIDANKPVRSLLNADLKAQIPAQIQALKARIKSQQDRQLERLKNLSPLDFGGALEMALSEKQIASDRAAVEALEFELNHIQPLPGIPFQRGPSLDEVPYGLNLQLLQQRLNTLRTIP